jgi:hypothetical protein
LVAFDGLSCLAGLFLFHLRKKKEEKKEEKYWIGEDTNHGQILLVPLC